MVVEMHADVNINFVRAALSKKGMESQRHHDNYEKLRAASTDQKRISRQ